MKQPDPQLTAYLNYLEERGQVFVPTFELEPSAIEQAPLEESKLSFHAFIGKNPKAAVWVPCKDHHVSHMPQDEKLLLAKILKAIGLSFDEILILPFQEANESVLPELETLMSEHALQQILLFGEIQRLDLVTKTFPDTRSVYSLRDISTNPQLKRDSWNILKSFKF